MVQLGKTSARDLKIAGSLPLTTSIFLQFFFKSKIVEYDEIQAAISGQRLNSASSPNNICHLYTNIAYLQSSGKISAPNYVSSC